MRFMKVRKNLLLALSLLLMIIITGTAGYMIIEGYTFIQSLYMTFIVISTVGLGEARDLDNGGKIFTILLIISSLGIVAYAFSTFSKHLIEGELRFFIRGQIKKSGLKKMNNHVIVCGYGRNGKQAAEDLTAHGVPFVVIDNRREAAAELADSKIMFIEGDATEDQVLTQAGVRNARALITSLPNDADNLFVVLTSRSLNPELIIISRASNDATERKLKVAGVNNVVLPEKVGGSHMASLVIQPDVLEFLDCISIHGSNETNLVEFTCSNINSEYVNKTIRELELRVKTGATIIGFKTPEGEFIINPILETRLIKDSKFFVLGTPQQINKMAELLTGTNNSGQ
jgi:voltage-gated potassium channel